MDKTSMGWARKRKQVFLRGHPMCCYCANSPATTIDHNPAAECFKDGIGPEGYEFPSCEKCNHSTSQLEQAVALILRRVDRNPKNASPKQLTKLMQGVINNTPAMLPNEQTSLRDRANAYASYGMPSPPIENLARDEFVGSSVDGDRALWAFGRKLTCALYYKEMKQILPLDTLISTGWQAASHPQIGQIITPAIAALPTLVKADRYNTDIGDQFSYRWNTDLSTDEFMFVAKFGRALFVRGNTIPKRFVTEPDPDVRLHADDAATTFHSKISIPPFIFQGFIHG